MNTANEDGNSKEPVTVSLEKVLAAKERGLVEYILNAFLSDRPSLIPFVFDNQSVLKVARHYCATAQDHPTPAAHTPYKSENTQSGSATAPT